VGESCSGGRRRWPSVSCVSFFVLGTGAGGDTARFAFPHQPVGGALCMKGAQRGAAAGPNPPPGIRAAGRGGAFAPGGPWATTGPRAPAAGCRPRGRCRGRERRCRCRGPPGRRPPPGCGAPAQRPTLTPGAWPFGSGGGAHRHTRTRGCGKHGRRTHKAGHRRAMGEKFGKKMGSVSKSHRSMAAGEQLSKKIEPPQGVPLINEMCLQTPVEDGNAEECMYPGQENVEGRGDGRVPRWDLAGPGVC